MARIKGLQRMFGMGAEKRCKQLGLQLRVEIAHAPAAHEHSQTNRWFVEVVDEDDNSMVWDQPFESDDAADREFRRKLAEEGIEAMVGLSPQSMQGDLPSQRTEVETTVADPARKSDILFRLGEPRLDHANWPDYGRYGLTEADVDDLIALATDHSLHQAPGDSDAVWAPLHAWRALAQIGDPRAIEPLIGLFDALRDNDWAWEELPHVFAMLGSEAVAPLGAYLRARDHDEFAYGSAIGALEQIAKRDPSTRDAVVAIITDYLDHADLDAAYLNGAAVATLVTLQARESIEPIRRLYAAAAVDLFACGDIEDVEMELGLRSERSRPRPDLAKLYGFDERPSRSKKKVGRNDPCPCGSGKKYKKCCLN
jgi:hypothetical protein